MPVELFELPSLISNNLGLESVRGYTAGVLFVGVLCALFLSTDSVSAEKVCAGKRGPGETMLRSSDPVGSAKALLSDIAPCVAEKELLIACADGERLLSRDESVSAVWGE